MWDEKFAKYDFMFGTDPAQGLVRHLAHLHAQGKTLAVADGEGRNSVYLAEQGFDVDAMDSSQIGIAKAKRLCDARGVHVNYELADIFAYDWPEGLYDNVVAVFIQFAPPESWHQIFAGMMKALRPGGVLYLHGYTPKQIDYGTGGPPLASHLYTQDDLAHHFADMDIVVNHAYEAVLDEGPGHKGQSALIDFVAIKR